MFWPLSGNVVFFSRHCVYEYIDNADVSVRHREPPKAAFSPHSGSFRPPFFGGRLKKNLVGELLSGL